MKISHHAECYTFISECETDLPALPEYLSCYLASSCVEVNCCLNVPVINRDINFYVSLNTWTSILKLGIEDFTKDIVLLEDSDWNLDETLNLFGLFEFKYVYNILKSFINLEKRLLHFLTSFKK